MAAQECWRLPKGLENDLSEILTDLQVRMGDGKPVLMLASFSPFCLKISIRLPSPFGEGCSALAKRLL